MISGVELDDRQGRVTVLDISDSPGFAARILRRIAEENIFVDMIVQNISLVGNAEPVNHSTQERRRTGRRGGCPVVGPVVSVWRRPSPS